MGFFKNLWHGIKNTVHNAWNEVKQRGTTLFTNSHYIGPYNALSPEYIRTHPPKDPVDAGALHHDLDYSRIAKARDAKIITDTEAKNMIRESDNRFLHNTKQNFSSNPLGASLGYLGIKGKTLLEDIGVLNPNQFVTAKLGGKIIGGKIMSFQK